jgi:acetolactate synthase-1/2/3 large subunit
VITGGQALASQLAREGVEYVFGVPGVQLDYAIDGLAGVSDQVHYLNTRHEQATSYMADGYARTTGKVGVCMVVPGPGLLNAMAGLATAYACSSRVLCISGQIPSNAIGRGFGLLHEIPRQSMMLGALTKWSACAAGPDEVAPLVNQAMRQLRGGRPQPVGLEVPPDVLQATTSADLPQPIAHDEPTVPQSGLLERAAQLIARAQRPLLYVGGGVVASNGSLALRGLAERLEAPVLMTGNGRGALDDRHPLALTALAGRELLADADLVLAVGTRFMNQQQMPALAPGAELLLLNADERDLGAPRTPTLAIRGDAALGLAALTALSDNAAKRPSRRAEVQSVRTRFAERLGVVEPQSSWLRAMRTAMPDDGILINEFTQVGYLATAAWPVYQPRTYISSGYQGTLGYGFPTALGAKVGNPRRTVLSITGDGGFGWGLSELSTARKHAIGLVTVVFNDSAYGNVRRTQVEDFGGRIMGSELLNPDFVALAESFGVRGARATSPAELHGLLRETLGPDNHEPVVIDVPVGPMPNPWRQMRPNG